MDIFGRLDAHTFLESERDRVQAQLVHEQVGGENAEPGEKVRTTTAKGD
jgi:hypothetical protein